MSYLAGSLTKGSNQAFLLPLFKVSKPAVDCDILVFFRTSLNHTQSLPGFPLGSLPAFAQCYCSLGLSTCTSFHFSLPMEMSTCCLGFKHYPYANQDLFPFKISLWVLNKSKTEFSSPLLSHSGTLTLEELLHFLTAWKYPVVILDTSFLSYNLHLAHWPAPLALLSKQVLASSDEIQSP